MVVEDVSSSIDLQNNEKLWSTTWGENKTGSKSEVKIVCVWTTAGHVSTHTVGGEGRAVISL